jgi:hypothetical protein
MAMMETFAASWRGVAGPPRYRRRRTGPVRRPPRRVMRGTGPTILSAKIQRSDLSEMLKAMAYVKRVGPGYRAKCPAHDDGGRALRVKCGDGWFQVGCTESCHPRAVFEALGKVPRNPKSLAGPTKKDRWGWRLAVYDSRLKRADTLVLYALAGRMDQGNYCFPSIRRIATDTGLAERTVFYSRKRLRQYGYLTWEQSEGRSSCGYTIYGPRLLRPFPKGVSGNPGGRPRGLVRSIREQTRDGSRIVRLMVRILDGQPVKSGGKRIWPTLQDRWDAATWLADHGFGRPSTVAELVHLEQELREPTVVEERQPLTPQERRAISHILEATHPKELSDGMGPIDEEGS